MTDSAEKDAPRSHPKCWTGVEYDHRCHKPSGRRCIDCGEPAGTPWGPLWCPACDVIRLDRVSASLNALTTVIASAEPDTTDAAPVKPRTQQGGSEGDE